MALGGGYSERIGETMGETTGVERLRELGREQEERSWSTVGKVRGRLMLEIAGQIEDERLRERLAVGRVASEMELHCLGVEGMEDSPVARWARELREALVGDAEADEDREAVAWVCEHGGLSHVKDVLHDLRAVVERLGIEWSESELHGLMDALDRRLMPEGYEWPLFEDGASVRCGDEFLDGLGHPHRCTSIELVRGDGEYGACDSFLHWNDDEPDEVLMVSTWEGNRVRRPAVLAADGEPLEAGQTVYNVEDGTEYEVCKMGLPRVTVEYWCEGIAAHSSIIPSLLTHTKPAIDSWERIEEDKGLNPFDYCKKVGHKLWTFDNAEEVKASDLVRRCKALAERERGE